MRSLYLERPTWLHVVPAGLKLAALSLAGALLFLLDSLPLTAGFAAVVAVLVLSLGPSARRVAGSLAPLLLVLALILAFHALLGSWRTGLEAALRIGALAALGFLLTLTTSFDALLSVAEA